MDCPDSTKNHSCVRESTSHNDYYKSLQTADTVFQMGFNLVVLIVEYYDIG